MAYDSHGSLNRAMIIGRLAKDASEDLKYTPSGVAVVSFSIATTTSYKVDDKTTDKTEWIRCVAWRQLAEIIGKYGKKGGKVFAEGRLATREWADKDGAKRWTTEVVLDSLQLLDSKPKDAETESVPFDNPNNPDIEPDHVEDGMQF